MNTYIKYIKVSIKIITVILMAISIGIVFIVSNQFHEPTVLSKFFYFLFFTPFTSAIGILTLACNRNTQFTWTDLFVCIYLLYFTIHYLYHGTSNNQAITVLLLGNYYFVCRNAFAFWEQLKEYVLLIIILAGIGEAIIGLLQLYGICESYHKLHTVTGTFFNPGPYGGYLACILCISIAYIIKNRQKVKLIRIGITQNIPMICLFLSYILVILCIWVIPVTMSRSAWVATFGTIALIILFESKCRDYICNIWKKSKAKSYIGLFSIITCLIIAGVLLYQLKKGSVDSRFFTWKITGKIINDNYLFGIGTGYFRGEYGKYQANYFKVSTSDKNINQADSPIFAFNEYLQITAEQGIIGILIFSGIIASSFHHFHKRQNVFHFGIISILIFGITSYPFRILPILILFTVLISSQESKVILKGDTSKFLLGGLTLIGLGNIGLILKYRETKITAYEQWKVARLLYKERDLSALPRYNRLFKILYEEELFLFEYGQLLNKNKEYTKSNKILLLGTTISNDPMFYNIIGNNYKALGYNKKASEYYLFSHNMLPNRIYPIYLQGLLYLESGDTCKMREIAIAIQKFQPKIVSSATDEIKKKAAEWINQ